MEDADIIYRRCGSCKLRIGAHSIVESLLCKLITKEEALKHMHSNDILKSVALSRAKRLITKEEAREALRNIKKKQGCVSGSPPSRWVKKEGGGWEEIEQS